MTRYVGLFCPDGHFNVLDTYEVEHPDAPIGLDLIMDESSVFQCEECGKAFSYEQVDVVRYCTFLPLWTLVQISRSASSYFTNAKYLSFGCGAS